MNMVINETVTMPWELVLVYWENGENDAIVTFSVFGLDLQRDRTVTYKC